MYICIFLSTFNEIATEDGVCERYINVTAYSNIFLHLQESGMKHYSNAIQATLNNVDIGK